MDFLLRRRAHAAKSASMKCRLRADDFEALAFFARFPDAVQSGEFEQAFVGLSAGIAKKHPSRACIRHQPLGQLTLERIAIQITDMHQGGGLRGDRLYPTRVTMPDRVYRDARGKIEITLAGVVPDAATLTPRQRDGRTAIVAQYVGVVGGFSRSLHDLGLAHRLK